MGLVYYTRFKVSAGWCVAARSGKGICAFVLPVNDARLAESAIKKAYPSARRCDAEFRALAEKVEYYYDGGAPDFSDVPLDMSSGTLFQRRVWAVTRRISYGHVRSYRWVGMKLGKPGAARAVGGALAANPLSLLIPCHRVIGADGKLHGFSAFGGLGAKAAMLQLEGTTIESDSFAERPDRY